MVPSAFIYDFIPDIARPMYDCTLSDTLLGQDKAFHLEGCSQYERNSGNCLNHFCFHFSCFFLIVESNLLLGREINWGYCLGQIFTHYNPAVTNAIMLL